MKINFKLRILEFIVAGLILDLIENIISIKLTTNAEITANVFWIALMVVIPFAIVTELIIDHPNFWHKILRIKPPR
ncbi:MAG: hypothetical protein Q7S32_02475 [bacterium]|nr:hypothetical protein [bacterium]